MRVLSTAGVRSIVGFGQTDVPVEEAEISTLRQVMASGLPLSPWPYLRTGERVRIEGGALAGVSGTLVREKNSWRVVVNVELLQRSVAVEIDRDLITAREHGTSSSATCQQQLSC